MKILHVLDWYRPFGGAERLLFCMLDLLEQDGHQNIVVANDVPGQARSGRRSEYFVRDLEVGFLGVSPLTFFGVAPWILRLRRTLKAIVDEHRPDLVHFHNTQNPFVVSFLSKILPSVRSIHDPRLYCFTDWKLLPNRDICRVPLGRNCLVQGCIPRHPLAFSTMIHQIPYRMRHFQAHRRVGVLIAESHAVRENLIQNGFPAEQVRMLPNMTPLYGSWEDVCRFNEKRYVPGRREVLFVGRASYEKGIEYLLDAMALIPKPWKLVLVTGGEYLPRVRERIERLNLGNDVELPGVLSYEDTRERYASADVVVFPSVWIESFGLVGLEAMANGKPVVAFRTGGIPDWLDHGNTGLLAELKDTRDLADKIKRVLDDPALAAKMGHNGYQRVVEFYNGEIYKKGLLDIYEAARKKSC